MSWLATIASLGIIAAYIYTSFTDKMLPMQWANLIGSVILFPINLVYAPWNCLLNLAFAFGGLAWLVRYYTGYSTQSQPETLVEGHTRSMTCATDCSCRMG
jgi:hypothetical protein